MLRLLRMFLSFSYLHNREPSRAPMLFRKCLDTGRSLQFPLIGFKLLGGSRGRSNLVRKKVDLGI